MWILCLLRVATSFGQVSDKVWQLWFTHTVCIFCSRSVDDGDTLSNAEILIGDVGDSLRFREELVTNGKWFLVADQLIAKSRFSNTLIVET